MVASRAINDLSKFDTYCTRTETLTDWITTVRYKKGLIRKQRKNRDLRIAAVLKQAIIRAEQELKRKQCERAQKWAQVRSQYEDGESSKVNVRETFHENNNNYKHGGGDDGSGAAAEYDDEEVAKLWTSELLGLDNLFSDLNQIKTVVAR